MRVFVDDVGSLDSLRALIRTALDSEEVGSLLVLACDGNGYDCKDLDPLLRSLPVPVFGGLFPAVIGDGKHLSRGNVVVVLKQKAEIYRVPDLSNPAVDFEAVLDEQVGEEEFKTLFVFLDGLSSRIMAFVEALYTTLGLEINYIGGGAGSLSFKPKPCLITNDGLVEDGAILAALDLKSGIGVRHGWEPLVGSFKVTEAEGNLLKSLDWKPALEVYKDVVECHSGKSFDAEPFINLAMAYPFGIAKFGSEKVVRDPVGVDDDNNLVCVGEFPVGEYVDVLHGKAGDLIAATAQAATLARNEFPDDATPGLNLLIDCISRVLFLDEQYTEEMRTVTMEGIPTVGVCSIGEIANSGKDFLDFYNKTSVSALLEAE